jgi:multiple sugar transport system substrate-binding protein
MMKNSLIWAEGGHIPAYLPILESQKYKDLTPQSNYAGVADDVILDPNAWFSGSGSDMETQASVPLQQAMAGAVEPKQAVDDMRASMQALVNTPSPL